MWLPTRAQVDSASRHAITIVSTATVIFGLQARGFDPQVIISVIQSLGPAVNDIVNLIGAGAAAYAMLKASHSASPTSQSASLGANSTTIVNATPGGTATVTLLDPAMATAALTAQKNAA